MQDVLDVVKVETRDEAPLAVVTLEDLHGRFLGDQSTTGSAKVNHLCNCVRTCGGGRKSCQIFTGKDTHQLLVVEGETQTL